MDTNDHTSCQREIDHVRELMDLEFKKRDLALDLQSQEYKRRLDDLNHAHAEAVRVQGTYVPRETYEQRQRELEMWRRVVDSALDLNAGQNKGIGLAWSVLIAAVGATLGIIGVAIGVIN